jgi:SOS-response transcriptional repressor LexA
MNPISKRLASEIAEQGLSQSEVAARASTKRRQVTQQTVQHLVSGRNQSSRDLPQIAKALGVRVEWLLEGSGPKKAPPTPGASVPLVSFVQAGSWTENAPFPEPDEWIACDSRVSERAFALRVKGLSMMPRFYDGDVIIVDPVIEPVPGDFVVGKIRGEDEATFKQYRRKNPKEYELRALNPDYETLTVTAKTGGMIIGPVVEHHSYRRQP